MYTDINNLIFILFQINSAIEKVHMALASIKIDHKEAIVVPFRIP